MDCWSRGVKSSVVQWATLQIEKGIKMQKALAVENLIANGIIQREETSMEKEIAGQHRGYFNLADVMYFAKKGCEAVAEDEVTQRFTSEELLSWNLLSRTNANFHRVSWQLTAVWVMGILARYCLLVPFRILLLVIATTVVGQFPNGRVKHWLSNQVQMTCAALGIRCLSGLVQFHNRIREHIADKAKLPILIFPEAFCVFPFWSGTCINNTSVMMFKKGSFEVGGTIHPVAIKYDPRFGDAFWNSTKYSMLTYSLNVLTSWAIVCNVWYLPPMVKEEEEDAVHFANRVKAVIAARGGMSVLPW
ncbi:UNVERIFIED_CONTAM: hypothetical protein H355_012215 [Colinus virginianus]|nr:hypothetical protein H355_012215 [Colinus virginianus]